MIVSPGYALKGNPKAPKTRQPAYSVYRRGVNCALLGTGGESLTIPLSGPSSIALTPRAFRCSRRCASVTVTPSTLGKKFSERNPHHHQFLGRVGGSPVIMATLRVRKLPMTDTSKEAGIDGEGREPHHLLWALITWTLSDLGRRIWLALHSLMAGI